MQTIKRYGKNFLCFVMERQVRRLRHRNGFFIVAVVGSVGKTSTKLAIAKTLSSRQAVIYQEGNYNDRLTVPLVLFGQTQPGLFSIVKWAKILIANERISRTPYPYGVAVLELGTDAPGQLKDFAYLNPELLVVTSIAAEHMEYFKTLQAVATEELVPLGFSKAALLNLDDIDDQFLPSVEYLGYGQNHKSVYKLLERHGNGLGGQNLSIHLKDENIEFRTTMLGQQGAKIALAAAATAHCLGWSADEIIEGVQAIAPVSGRLQILEGLHGSKILDDSYNASPISVKAALDVLSDAPAETRIAILGTMNELGENSPANHKSVGQHCDPKKIDLVVTVGSLAEQYLAPAAQANGCNVISFRSPVEAGLHVKHLLNESTIVLAKGSQNGVFAEEAVKQLLRHHADSSKLVRQSAFWINSKQKQFPEVTA